MILIVRGELKGKRTLIDGKLIGNKKVVVSAFFGIYDE
jgi:hypothetical protein